MTAYENDILRRRAHHIRRHAFAHRAMDTAGVSGLLVGRRLLLWINKR